MALKLLLKECIHIFMEQLSMSMTDANKAISSQLETRNPRALPLLPAEEEQEEQAQEQEKEVAEE